MSKVISLRDYEQKTVQNHALLLNGMDAAVLMWIDPTVLPDHFDADQVEASYKAIPKTLCKLIAELRSAKVAPNYQDGMLSIAEKMESILRIMEQSMQIEENDSLAIDLQEALRNECVAAILAIRQTYLSID